MSNTFAELMFWTNPSRKFLTNFQESASLYYEAAVFEYNARSKTKKLVIRNEAFSTLGKELSGLRSLHVINLDNGVNDLSDFWNIWERKRANFFQNQSSEKDRIIDALNDKLNRVRIAAD